MLISSQDYNFKIKYSKVQRLVARRRLFIIEMVNNFNNYEYLEIYRL